MRSCVWWVLKPPSLTVWKVFKGRAAHSIETARAARAQARKFGDIGVSCTLFHSSTQLLIVVIDQFPGRCHQFLTTDSHAPIADYLRHFDRAFIVDWKGRVTKIVGGGGTCFCTELAGLLQPVSFIPAKWFATSRSPSVVAKSQFPWWKKKNNRKGSGGLGAARKGAVHVEESLARRLTSRLPLPEVLRDHVASFLGRKVKVVPAFVPQLLAWELREHPGQALVPPSLPLLCSPLHLPDVLLLILPDAIWVHDRSAVPRRLFFCGELLYQHMATQSCARVPLPRDAFTWHSLSLYYDV